MISGDLCTAVGESLSPLFVCSPFPRGVRVRTPLMYPDGGVVDVFVVESASGYTVTDYGDALGWLGLQSVSQGLSPKQNLLVSDVCQTLRLELLGDALQITSVSIDMLSESVVRVAQGAVRVSDLWFTLRNQSLQATADEVEEWLREKEISYQRGVRKVGRSQRTWNVDFETVANNRSCLIFLLCTGSRGSATRVTEHVVAGCVDLSHLPVTQKNLSFVSLFDDTIDIWRQSDFSLVEAQSMVAFWSRPDEFENILRGDYQPNGGLTEPTQSLLA